MIRIGLEAQEPTIRGILRYKRRNGKYDWHFPLILDYRESLTSERVQSFNLDAAIGYIGADTPSDNWFHENPFINLSAGCALPGVPSVPNDDIAIGVLAGEHLIELGLNSYHFVTIVENPVTQARFDGFKTVLGNYNRHPEYHRIVPERKAVRIRNQQHDPTAFHTFLKTVTLPAAVFCMNDACAFSLVTACTSVGLRVPEDICVVGVNNDQIYSRLTDPMLTSVKPDLMERGYRAAELLDQVLSGKGVPPVPHPVPPSELIPRGSTHRLGVECAEVATALKFIGTYAGEHITVSNVVTQTPFSRRSLEMKFKQHLGRTIMDEIISTRLRIACDLLKTTNMILDEVAYRSGFPNPARLQAAIKAETGMTAAEFRRAKGSRSSDCFKT